MNTTEELRCELDHTDRRTLALIESLTDAQFDVPYHRGINPPIWELGHSAFFYEYFLLRKLGHAEPRMPGYDEIWDSFEIQHRNRWQDDVIPSKETTFDYYHRILDETRKRLQVEELDPQEHYLCQYCIVHQNMHIESLIWARQTLGYPAPPSMIEPFAISKTLVSNREFLAFVKDGGYQSPEVWSYGGRWWLQEEGPAHPLYWREKKDTWELRRFDQWIDLPLHAPVLHVSYWEAEAFCNWADRRLPTEYEWEAAARGTKGTLFPWGDEMDPTRADLDVEEMGSANVDAFPASATPSGCLQMIGTAWEWTSNQYLPYPGFEVDIYPYMSTLQFGDHKTTKGGSCATSSCLIRSSYRQAYSPGRRDVFTGIRTCAK